jgi:integrase
MTVRFSRLTRPEIRKLKPGGRITEAGITAEKLFDGDVRYAVGVMFDGRRLHRVIGKESDGTTRTQCEEFIEKARSDARAGRLSLPRGRKLPLTFAGAVDAYIKRLEESGGRNLTIKRRQLRMYLTPYFGTMRLDAVTAFTIEKYKKRRCDQGAAPATVNRELATLSHLLNRAVEWRWLDRLPVRPKKLAESIGRIIALTDDECDRLMAAAVTDATSDLWLFIAFGLNTAMRHSEILAVRWEQIDLTKLRLYVPKAKTGQREQPITPELAQILVREREMRDDRTGWIFPRRTKTAVGGTYPGWIGRSATQ